MEILLKNILEILDINKDNMIPVKKMDKANNKFSENIFMVNKKKNKPYLKFKLSINNKPAFINFQFLIMLLISLISFLFDVLHNSKIIDSVVATVAPSEIILFKDISWSKRLLLPVASAITLIINF